MARKPIDVAKEVQKIVKGYRGGEHFELSRGELHDLPPEAMREVLALATAPVKGRAKGGEKGRDLLVMALSDVAYPPAFPAMRAWLDDEDVEKIVMPAISALDRAAGGAFDADRMWRDFGLVSELRVAIAAWWDAGAGLPSTAEEPWLTEQVEKRARDAAEVPPPQTNFDQEEKQELYDDTVALKRGVDALDVTVAWKLDVAALRRALPIYERWAQGSPVLRDALAATERAIAGDTSAPADREAVRAAVQLANKASRWSRAHQGYHNLAAKAAACVAQGTLYAIGPGRQNRLLPMHYAREAMEWSGTGLAAVRAELHWQLAAVRAAG